MKSRIDNLDLLRASAISLVILFHLPSFVPWSEGLGLQLVQGWWSGVDLFFMLSGYLVGGLFWSERIQRGEVNAGMFILRRALRTVPPYLTALHLIYLSRWIAGAPIAYDWKYWIFLQNYTGMSLFSVSWSLCVEEHFYLVAPFLMALVARLERPWLLLLLLPLPLASRLLFAEPGAGPFGPHYYSTHNHFEGLVLGVWLAYVRIHRSVTWDDFAKRLKPLLFPVVGLVVGYQFLGTPQYAENVLSYSAFALAYGFILFEMVSLPALGISKSRLAKLIGREAYSLYLTHSYVLLMFRQFVAPHLGSAPPIVQGLLALVAVALGGHLFYLCVERPALALRDFLLSRWDDAHSRNAVAG